MISSSGSTRAAICRSPPVKASMEMARISVTAASSTFSSRRALSEKTIFFSSISWHTSATLQAWSEIRSKSEMVCRYLATSSVCSGDRERAVSFMR